MYSLFCGACVGCVACVRCVACVCGCVCVGYVCVCVNCVACVACVGCVIMETRLQFAPKGDARVHDARKRLARDHDPTTHVKALFSNSSSPPAETCSYLKLQYAWLAICDETNYESEKVVLTIFETGAFVVAD